MWLVGVFAGQPFPSERPPYLQAYFLLPFFIFYGIGKSKRACKSSPDRKIVFKKFPFQKEKI
jgi:hypothetical protein